MQGSVPLFTESTMFHDGLSPASLEPLEVAFLKRLRRGPQQLDFGLRNFKLPDPLLDLTKLRSKILKGH